MKKERVMKSSGNVFVVLGFEPAEAQVLALRADLMVRLRRLIVQRGWTQVEAARELGIAQSRVSDLTNGKWEKFSLDMLVRLAVRGGKRVKLALAA